LESSALQRNGSRIVIVSLVGMLTTIEFNYQAALYASEVCKVAANRMLAAEFIA
jgi:hypothetical protein